MTIFSAEFLQFRFIQASIVPSKMKVVAVLLFAASFIASASAAARCPVFKTCQTKDSDKAELARADIGKLFPLCFRINVYYLILANKVVDCRDGCLGWECTRDRVHYRGRGCVNEVHDPCGGTNNVLESVSLYGQLRHLN